MTHSLMSKTGLPKRFVGNSIFIGYITLLLPLWLVLISVPNEIPPFWGWLLTFEWIFFLHGTLFSLYLKYCHDTGKIVGSSSLPTFKVRRHIHRSKRTVIVLTLVRLVVQSVESHMQVVWIECGSHALVSMAGFLSLYLWTFWKTGCDGWRRFDSHCPADTRLQYIACTVVCLWSERKQRENK